MASSGLASCVPNSDARGEVALLAIVVDFEGAPNVFVLFRLRTVTLKHVDMHSGEQTKINKDADDGDGELTTAHFNWYVLFCGRKVGNFPATRQVYGNLGPDSSIEPHLKVLEF